MSEFWDPEVPKRRPDAESVHDRHLIQAWCRRSEIQVVVRRDATKESAAIRELDYPKQLSAEEAVAVAATEWRSFK